MVLLEFLNCVSLLFISKKTQGDNNLLVHYAIDE